MILIIKHIYLSSGLSHFAMLNSHNIQKAKYSSIYLSLCIYILLLFLS